MASERAQRLAAALVKTEKHIGWGVSVLGFWIQGVWARRERGGNEPRKDPPDTAEDFAEKVRDAIAAFLDAADVRMLVLGPGEGVVRVRVAQPNEPIGERVAWSYPDQEVRTWSVRGKRTPPAPLTEDLRFGPFEPRVAHYVLLDDLDRAAAGLGKGGANG